MTENCKEFYADDPVVQGGQSGPLESLVYPLHLRYISARRLARFYASDSAVLAGGAVKIGRRKSGYRLIAHASVQDFNNLKSVL